LASASGSAFREHIVIIFSEIENFVSACAKVDDVRVTVVAAASALAAGMFIVAPQASNVSAPQAHADPQTCNDAFCVPGIIPHRVLGAPCDNTTYYVFATTDWGRLMFCGSPRRYDPRWFRSPPMAGIRDENSNCISEQNMVAQAPDGLFLTCVAMNGVSRWMRGDT
jgi:hypothetical protein